MMKGQKSIILLILLVVSFVLSVLMWGMWRNQGTIENIGVTTERPVEEESSAQPQTLSTEEASKEETVTSDNSIVEGEESLGETKFSYGYREHNKEDLPRRFGYVVEEDIEDREVPLQEEDFKKLREGQYFDSDRKNAKYPIGIVDVVGWFDGQIMYTPRNDGTGEARISPYYKIDDNTYVILFFENNRRTYPLERIEVWDADGNKLRDIEID